MLELSRITKRFGNFTALEAFDFQVRPGEIVALLGENGAGKSTTINLIGGEMRPDEGELRWDGAPARYRSPREASRQGIGIVHQHFRLVPSFTVGENLALHQTGAGARFVARHWEAQASEWAARLGWTLDTRRPVGELAVGAQQRVEILKALFGGGTPTRLLLLDEPTANLTPREAEDLFGVLRRLRGEDLGIVFVSHKLREVMAVCDRAVVLRRGRLAGERAIGQTDAGDLARLMVGEETQWTADAAAVGAPIPDADSQTARNSQSVSEPGPVTLQLKELSAPGLGSLNLEVRAGEIVGLAGVDGNGQRELFEVLCGLRRPRGGTMIAPPRPRPPRGQAAGRGGVTFVPPDRREEGLILTFDIAENLAFHPAFRARFSRFGRFDWRGARRRAAELMEEYDIRSPQTGRRRGSERTLAGRLSGGNAQKVVLARALAFAPELVVAVDPTRGLDVGATAFVHRRLREAAQAGTAVLLISTDLDEVLGLCDRIGVLFGGRIAPESGPLPRGDAGRERVGRLMGGESPGE